MLIIIAESSRKRLKSLSHPANAGLSLLVAVLALFATGWQGFIARDAERRSPRAYVTSDEPLVTSITNSAGAVVEWKLLPKWADHGVTPTRNLTFVLHCISVLKATGALFGDTPTPASSRDIHFDVFGEPHHSEQCFTVEFLNDPLSVADAKRTIGACERNCEDEECQTVPAPAARHRLLDQLLGGRRLIPASPQVGEPRPAWIAEVFAPLAGAN
jgi:hypothetical protein